jgi:SIR2-like domain/CHAT domain
VTEETAAVQRLRRRIADRKVIVVVGAGVSIGATMRDNGTPHPYASWAGLVSAGAQEMGTYGAPEQVVDYARYLLQAQKLEEVADLIIENLKSFYADWLQRSFDAETFTITNSDVPQALHALGCPILTTNYDDVLERVSGRGTLEWRNPEAWAQAQKDPTRYVLHIHGTFTDSASVVFSRKDYEELVNDTKNQSLWQALATQYSLLFVGVGKSFDDRNFTRLGGYLKDVLGQAGQEHYRLVYAGQNDGVDRQGLFEQKILQIEYGTSSGDLAGFLTGLVPSVPDSTAAPELPPPAVLSIDVDDSMVHATLLSDTASPQSADERCGLNAIALETLSLFDEWIRSDPLGGSGADEREGLRTRVIQQMGRILFDAVFHGDVRKLYQDGLRYQAQLREELVRAGQADAWAPLEIVLRIKKKIVPLFQTINQIDLDDLPWELLFDANSGHLSVSNNVVLVRGTEDQARRFEDWQPPNQLNVLVVLAQPEELVSRVRASWPGGKGYDTVIANIRSAIGAWDSPGDADRGSDTAQDNGDGAARDRVHVFELDDPGNEHGNDRGDEAGDNREQRAARRRSRVTWARFKAALDTSAQPSADSSQHVDVVHFIGHAGVTGLLYRFVAFEAPEPDAGPSGAAGAAVPIGDTQWVSFEEIGNFINNLDEKDRPTLVMLHLCQGPAGGVNGPVGPLDLTRASFSQLGYQLMQAQIPLVVAMQYPMWPDAGAVFTRTFYGKVQTATVPQAIQAARNAVARGVAGAGGPVGPVFFMGANVRQILVPQAPARRGKGAAPPAAGRIGPSKPVSRGAPPPGATTPGRTPIAIGSDRFQQDPRDGGASNGV